MFKRGTKSWLIWNCILAVLFLAIGITSLVLYKDRNYQSTIIMIVGIVVVVISSLRLLLNLATVINLGKHNLLADTRSKAIITAFELAVGISIIHLARLLLTDAPDANFFFHFLGDFFGIAAIVVGALILIYAIILAIKSNRKLIDTVLMVLCSIILVTVGILILVYLTNRDVMNVIFVSFGIFAIVTGLALIGGSIVVIKLARRKQAFIADAIAKEEASKSEEAPKEEGAPEEEKKAE